MTRRSLRMLWRERLARLTLLVLAGAVVGGSSGSLDPLLARFRLDAEPMAWKLPKKLHEISGLATTADGRLLAHEDQNAIVYEIDREEGKLVKAFALGKPTVTGDFEGIAVAGERVYLITSAGRLYQAKEAADGERSRFNSFDTEVDTDCREVEGLAYVAVDRALAIACKQLRGDRGDEEVWIFRWSLERHEPLEPIRIPAEQLAPDGDSPVFRPSAIEWDPASTHLLLLSARAHALAEVTLSGEVLGVRSLEAERHRQAEGLTFAAGSSLLVADEGAGKRPRLTIYPEAPSKASAEGTSSPASGRER